MKKPNSLKHKELWGWYQNNKTDDSPVYSNFYERVVRYGMTKEKALVHVREWKTKSHTDNNGRECNCCLVYKLRSEYHNSKKGYNKKTSDCIECRTKRKQEYSKRTNRQKDKERKIRMRTFEIGQKVAFLKPIYIDGLPREDQWIVIGYKYKKGYLLQSLHTGERKYMTRNKQYGNTKSSYRDHYIIIEENKVIEQPIEEKERIGVNI